MAICCEGAVLLAFHCCFYFSAVLTVGVPFPFGMGCGVRLYRFLIIVFLSTLQKHHVRGLSVNVWDNHNFVKRSEHYSTKSAWSSSARYMMSWTELSHCCIEWLCSSRLLKIDTPHYSNVGINCTVFIIYYRLSTSKLYLCQ